MPSLAVLDVARVTLPYTTSRPAYTLTLDDGTIRLNGVRLAATDALDLSAALLAACDTCRWHRLPHTSRAGWTVSICRAVIYLNARPLDRADALDLSAALAHALNALTVKEPPMTTLSLTDAQILDLAAAQREASDKAHGQRGWIVQTPEAARESAPQLRARQQATKTLNPTPTPVKEYAHG
ncbi:hypothetical protein QQG74_09885 [Micromonospora sp. FIMYZ51]|uniref:hypothetical protein n=1 Tax=Micromonospora sp. FIMYZ51 TaxID=3051832 RepID=UPI00311EAEF5